MRGARPSAAFVRQSIAPRLTFRDLEILRCLYDHRIVTSEQLARRFWPGCSQAAWLCNRRLRVLSDLHCVDRYYPVVYGGGSAPAHVVLDYAGAVVLGLTGWRKLPALPVTFPHTVLVSEVALRGLCYGLVDYRLEFSLGSVRPDIYYPGRRLAVEVDTGSQSLAVLAGKAERYRAIQGLRVVMVTLGSRERLRSFLGALGGGVGARFADLEKLLQNIA